MTTIKISELLKSVVSLAEAHPDRQADCKYFHDNGHPCCIVGHAFRGFGVKKRDLGEDNGKSIASLADEGPLDIDVDSADALDKLIAIQGSQDSRNPWGVAVRRAISD